jgi:hypothetical protein
MKRTTTLLATLFISGIILADPHAPGDWVSLFDGKTLNGWRIFKNMPNNSWEVKDGTLHCKAAEDRAENKRSDLITLGEYGDFELELEWKISPKGNSGILYRATEGFDQPYLSGPEYQVIDDIGYPEKIEDWQRTGANYAMNAPQGAHPHPAGEWNSTRIVVRGNHVEHWLNGVKVVEYEFGSDDWKKRKAEGKWHDAAGYGVATKGHIDLQDHGNEAWYRNIRIKER